MPPINFPRASPFASSLPQPPKKEECQAATLAQANLSKLAIEEAAAPKKKRRFKRAQGEKIAQAACSSWPKKDPAASAQDDLFKVKEQFQKLAYKLEPDFTAQLGLKISHFANISLHRMGTFVYLFFFIEGVKMLPKGPLPQKRLFFYRFLYELNYKKNTRTGYAFLENLADDILDPVNKAKWKKSLRFLTCFSLWLEIGLTYDLQVQSTKERLNASLPISKQQHIFARLYLELIDFLGQIQKNNQLSLKELEYSACEAFNSQSLRQRKGKGRPSLLLTDDVRKFLNNKRCCYLSQQRRLLVTEKHLKELSALCCNEDPLALLASMRLHQAIQGQTSLVKQIILTIAHESYEELDRISQLKQEISLARNRDLSEELLLLDISSRMAEIYIFSLGEPILAAHEQQNQRAQPLNDLSLDDRDLIKRSRALKKKETQKKEAAAKKQSEKRPLKRKEVKKVKIGQGIPPLIQPKGEEPCLPFSLAVTSRLNRRFRTNPLDFNGLSHCSEKEIFAFDSSLHLYHFERAWELFCLEREKGATAAFQTLSQIILYHLGLANEQLLTPLYIAKCQGEVTHDIAYMSKELAFARELPLSPIVGINRASIAFRYPKSHYRQLKEQRQQVPKGLFFMQESLPLTNTPFLFQMLEELAKEGLNHFSECLRLFDPKKPRFEKGTEGAGAPGPEESGRQPLFTEFALPSPPALPLKEEGESLTCLQEELAKLEFPLEALFAKEGLEAKEYLQSALLHLKGLKALLSLIKAYPHQRFYSFYLQAITLRGQYAVENLLSAIGARQGLYFRSHAFSDYDALYGVRANLSEGAKKGWEYCDLKKSSDYPFWSLYNKRAKSSSFLQDLWVCYALSHEAMTAGEGFLSKESSFQLLEKKRDLLEEVSWQVTSLLKEVCAQLF